MVTATTTRLREGFPAIEKRTDKEKIYGARIESYSDVFNYILMIYNHTCRHCSSDQKSPPEYKTSIMNGSTVSRLSVRTQALANLFRVRLNMGSIWFHKFLQCFCKVRFIGIFGNIKKIIYSSASV